MVKSNLELIKLSKFFSKISGWIAISLALVVISGWIFNIAEFKSISPSFVSMKFNTAASFLLIGIALIIFHESNNNKTLQNITYSLSAIVFTISILTIIQYLFNVNLKIDELIIEEGKGSILTSSPGRMSFNSAICFMMLSLSFLFRHSKIKNIYPSQLFLLVSLVISFIAIAGYLYFQWSLLRFQNSTAMALHTAFLFFILSIGILLADPEKGFIKRLIGGSLSNYLLRMLIPTVVILTISLELIASFGINNGYFDIGFGQVVHTMGVIIFTNIIIWIIISKYEHSEIKQKKAEEKTDESERKFKSLIESANDAIIICDSKGNIQSVNKSFIYYFGYSKEEILGLPITLLIPSSSIKDYLEAISICTNNVPFATKKKFEAKAVRKDRAFFPISVSLSYWHAEEKIYFSAIIQDITEKKIAEKLLLENERKYRSLFNDDITGDFISNAEGNLIVCNASLTKMLKLNSIDELNKTNIFSLYKDPRAKVAILNALTNKKKIEHNEQELVLHDGSNIHIIENLVGDFDEKGRLVQIKGYLFDNTKRKISERRRALTTKVLSILNRPNDWSNIINNILSEIKEYTGFDAVGIRIKEEEDYPYFETNGFAKDFVEMEKSLCSKNIAGEIKHDSKGIAILECMCGNVIRGRMDSQSPYFTKGGSFWTNNTNELLSINAVTKGQTYVRNKCNSAGYLSVALVPIHSGEDVIGLLQLNDKHADRFTLDLIEFFEEVGIAIGIAYKRLQLDRLIIEQRDELKTITSAAMDAILTMDNSGNITFWNPASKTIFGYNESEVLGKNIHDLLVPQRYHNAFDKGFAEYKNTGEGNAMNKVLEMYAIHKNGNEFPVELSLSPVFRKNKWEAIGIIRDITARKKDEETINRNTDRLNRLLKIYQFKSKTIQEFLDYSLNEAIDLTSSKLGYIYFYNEEKKEFILNSWSKEVMAECKVMNPQTCYELDKTGLWGEAVRQRKEIVVNDFEKKMNLKKEILKDM